MGKASREKRERREEWTPFVPGTLPDVPDDLIHRQAKQAGVPYAEMKAVYDDMAKNEKIFVNNLYQVNVRKVKPIQEGWPDMLHLSIKRRDKDVIHDWRHLQQIKNEIVGPEYDAVELYPKESRLVDTANQYHLWVFWDEAFELKLGWTGRRLVLDKAVEGGKQRQFSQ